MASVFLPSFIVKAYCCQLNPVWEDKDSNLESLTTLLSGHAIEEGSLIVLPEMFATGFSMDFAKVAESPEQSPTLSFLSNLAQKHRSSILAGMVFNREETLTNDAVLIDASGQVVGDYAKIHPFTPSGEKEAGSYGSWVKTMPLGDWTLAPFVCYDLRFPEIFRLATPAAELLVVLANWPSPRVEHWVTLLKARAIENQAYVIGVNRVGSDPHLDFPGRSLIIDPKGEILAEGGDDVELLSAPLDLAAVRQWRNDFPASNDRHDPINIGVQNLLQSFLPAHLIPSRIIIVDSLPVTENGKVDDCALLQLENYDAAPHESERAPREPVEPTPASLTSLNQEGTKTPIFCIHGGDGGTLIYRQLSEGLAKDRPFYTLEAPELSGEGNVAPTIEETAKTYLQQIRTVQSEGPYLLGGYCFGGIVVYEIAQQLKAAGEEIELLCLFDTDNPSVAPRYLSLAERASRQWSENSDKSWVGKVGKLSGRLGEGLVNKIKVKGEKAAASVVTSTGMDASAKLQTLIMREAHERAMRIYCPKAYDGDVILFTAADQGDGVIYPPHLGWEGYVRGHLKVVTIPGEHLTIFQEPHVNNFSNKLREILANRV